MSKFEKYLLIIIAVYLIAMTLLTYNNVQAKATPETTETTTEVTETTTEPETTEVITTEPVTTVNYRIPITDNEIELLVRVVMSEASTEPYAGKVAVAETVINRVLSNKYADNVTDVIKQSGQYYTGNNGKPTEECYNAVYEALTTQTHPLNMYYFRAGYYHDWATDYMKIGNHYFSLGA